MHIIKMKTQKSIAAYEQFQKVENPIGIAYGLNCPELPNFYILDSEIFKEENVSSGLSELFQNWGNINETANVVIWTNEPQEKNQWLIDLCLKNNNITDFWFYCI